MTATRHVLVLNHFAVPRGHAGGTRHVELFDQLEGSWTYTLVGADRNLLSRDRAHASADSFRAVRTTPYGGNSASRILNWISYAVGALFVGIRHKRFDVVYASSPHLLTGLAGYLIARIRRTKFVLEVRDLWPRILVDMERMEPDSLIYRALRRLELFLYRRADEIVVLAAGAGKAIHSDCPEAKSISFVPNGSDPTMFEIDDDRTMLRERYGMEGLTFVYAGAHGPANGLDLVLDAAESVKTQHPEVQIMLVGDGIEKPRLIDEVAKRGLTNVQLRDPIPKAEMPCLLRSADVGLHVLADVPLFRYGVSPNKLFDYMAAVLPVVTNCPGEVAGIVIEAGAGVAVSPNDLGEAVRTVATASPEQLRSWGIAGRRFIQESRSREVLAAELAEVLDRTVAAGDRP